MAIKDSWLPLMDQVISASVHKHRRIIGMTSPRESAEVARLAEALAESFHLSRIRTLLFDVTPLAKGADTSAGWIPLKTEPADFTTTTKAGYDLLASHPDRQNRFVFNNTDELRRTLDTQLGGYGAIIVNLPPVLADEQVGINPASFAAACDALYLVCRPGEVTRRDLTETRDRLHNADAPLSGLISDESSFVTTGESMAQQLTRLKPYLPVVERLADRVRRLDFLN